MISQRNNYKQEKKLVYRENLDREQLKTIIYQRENFKINMLESFKQSFLENIKMSIAQLASNMYYRLQYQSFGLFSHILSKANKNWRKY